MNHLVKIGSMGLMLAFAVSAHAQKPQMFEGKSQLLAYQDTTSVVVTGAPAKFLYQSLKAKAEKAEWGVVKIGDNYACIKKSTMFSCFITVSSTSRGLIEDRVEIPNHPSVR